VESEIHPSQNYPGGQRIDTRTNTTTGNVPSNPFCTDTTQLPFPLHWFTYCPQHMYRVGFRSLTKLRIGLKRLPLKKYFLIFLNKTTLAKDSCARRSTRVNNCQNCRSESNRVKLDSSCLKKCTSINKTYKSNTAKTNIGDINRSKLRKLYSRVDNTF